MKKLLLLSLILLSCSNDDNENCTCDTKVYVTDGQTTNSFTVVGAESDCNGNVISLPEHITNNDNHFPTMKCLD